MNRAAPHRLALLLFLLLGAGSALAEPQRLDDSLSHTVPPTAQMQWLPQTQPGRDGDMEAWVRVNIHINTRDWAGRSGRVYMVLPRDQSASIEAVWTANGPLLAGRLLSGERALVYTGAITGDSLKDQLLVRLRSGTNWLSESRRLNFYFELEAD